MEDLFICQRCGEELSEDEMFCFDDVTMCEECYDERTGTCDNCGNRIWNDDNEGSDSVFLCAHCRDYSYTTCEDCGCLIHVDNADYAEDDDDYPYCNGCFERHSNSTIKQYSYKPEPIFYGDDERYFGVELEIDDAGKISENAAKILFSANIFDENIYIKSDGSLNDGLEIVTHPMSLAYHIKEMPWDDVMKTALRLGYRSHKTNTCGLHIHVNRTAFGETREIQDECISRVLYFVEHHWEELLKFSRRTQFQMSRWAARYGYKNQPKDILETAKKGGNGRYTCINITNWNTIEFRMFRGTLKLNTLIAALQLVDSICSLSIDLTDDEISLISRTDFVSKLDSEKYSELITYLKERRLYVNEPVEFKEDE